MLIKLNVVSGLVALLCFVAGQDINNPIVTDRYRMVFEYAVGRVNGNDPLGMYQAVDGLFVVL